MITEPQSIKQELEKATFPRLLGIEGSRKKASELHEKALQAIADFGDPAENLRKISEHFITRLY